MGEYPIFLFNSEIDNYESLITFQSSTLSGSYNYHNKITFDSFLEFRSYLVNNFNEQDRIALKNYQSIISQY